MRKIQYKFRKEIKIKVNKEIIIYCKAKETLLKFKEDIEKLRYTVYNFTTNDYYVDGIKCNYIKISKQYKSVYHNYWKNYHGKSSNKWNIDTPMIYKSILKALTIEDEKDKV